MFKLSTISTTIFFLIPICFSSQVMAKGKKHVSYDFAPILHVSPVIHREKHSTPYQDCWTEEIQIYSPYQQYPNGDSYNNALFGQNSYTGTVLGGLVGGGIGHALGHKKSNKKAGAIAGGLLGGAVAYDLTHNRKHASVKQKPHYEQQQHCKTRYETWEEEKTVGYKVRYRYNGHIYNTRTKNDPGKTLRLKIVATPAER